MVQTSVPSWPASALCSSIAHVFIPAANSVCRIYRFHCLSFPPFFCLTFFGSFSIRKYVLTDFVEVRIVADHQQNTDWARKGRYHVNYDTLCPLRDSKYDTVWVLLNTSSTFSLFTGFFYMVVDRHQKSRLGSKAEIVCQFWQELCPPIDPKYGTF